DLSDRRQDAEKTADRDAARHGAAVEREQRPVAVEMMPALQRRVATEAGHFLKVTDEAAAAHAGGHFAAMCVRRGRGFDCNGALHARHQSTSPAAACLSAEPTVAG